MKKGKNFLNISVNQLYTLFWKQRHLVLLIILLIAIYWKWWASGLRVATDFPAVSLPDLKVQFDLPRTWFYRGAIGFGGYSVFTLWSWPMDFIAGILSNFWLNFEILERIMFVVPTLVFGVYGIWNLLDEFKLSNASKFVATLFYLTNTYLLLLIDGGQLGIALAYSWFPVCYVLFTRSINGKLKSKVVAALGVWILGIFDIRFLYILGILLVFRFLYEFIFREGRKNWKEWILEWTKSGVIVLVIFIALNLYWILPLLNYPLSGTRISDLTKNSNLDFAQLKNSVSLLQPHWYQNIFGKISFFRKEFLLIPVIVFSAIFLNRNKKEVWFWVIVAGVSVFLAKGSNPPFVEIYPWLFDNIPGFSLFRDSTKFFFLVALSYSVLIAFCIDEVVKKLPRLKFVFPVVIVLYLLFLISPIYTAKMTGTFSTPRYGKEYSVLLELLENDSNFGRVFWIPSKTPLGYTSRIHPTIEASRLESMRPFAISTVGAYETQNFIREGNYMGELFDIMGIKYIAYPYLDPKRDDMSKEKVDYYDTFLNQIDTLLWTKEKVSNAPVPVFKTENSQERFFLSKNTYFIVGSDKIYQDIKNLGGKFSSNALIFAEENPGLINKIDKIGGAKIILFDKTEEDLVASFFNSKEFIYPASGLSSSPNETGWWKRGGSDIVWWRDFLQTKYGIDNLDFDYGGGWAIAEGEKQLVVGNNNLQITKNKTLWVRVMKSSKSGAVNFYQNANLIGSVDTKIKNPEKVEIKLTGNSNIPDKIFRYDEADFNWFKIGELVSDDDIIIKTKGDINVVNSLAVVSFDEESYIKTTVDLLRKGNKLITWNNINLKSRKDLFIGENNASILFKMFDPTHYKISIENLTSPATLFFSDTFDNKWQLNSEESYPLYSLMNGFSIAQNGEYDLYFTPQKYVMAGFIISALALTSCIMFLVWKRK